MGHEGIILVNSPISTFQQGLTHSGMSKTWIDAEGRWVARLVEGPLDNEASCPLTLSGSS